MVIARPRTGGQGGYLHAWGRATRANTANCSCDLIIAALAPPPKARYIAIAGFGGARCAGVSAVEPLGWTSSGYRSLWTIGLLADYRTVGYPTQAFSDTFGHRDFRTMTKQIARPAMRRMNARRQCKILRNGGHTSATVARAGRPRIKYIGTANKEVKTNENLQKQTCVAALIDWMHSSNGNIVRMPSRITTGTLTASLA